MAQTKSVEEFYTQETTENDVLSIAFSEMNLSEDDRKSTGFPKGFKITLTVEEIS